MQDGLKHVLGLGFASSSGCLCYHTQHIYGLYIPGSVVGETCGRKVVEHFAHTDGRIVSSVRLKPFPFLADDRMLREKRNTA